MSTTRPAASLLLLRDCASGPQILLTRRAGSMRNWADNWVFPGGRTEAFDCDPGTPQDDTPSAKCTAVRETFEETGALLAKHAHLPARSASLGALRAAPSEQFYSTLAQQGFTLALQDIVPWSHWIPPLEVPNRFDTQFFLGGLHADDALEADGRETLELAWWTPAAAAGAALENELRCAPPTIMNLLELRQLATHAASAQQLLQLARGREFVTIFPRVIMDQGERWALYPWDAQYAALPPGGTLPYIPQRYQELPSRLRLRVG